MEESRSSDAVHVEKKRPPFQTTFIADRGTENLFSTDLAIVREASLIIRNGTKRVDTGRFHKDPAGR